jgi:uncharacterized RDD family membrane protein YckC
MNANVNPYAAPTSNIDAGVVADELPLAGRGARLGASILDGVVVGFVPGVIMVVAGVSVGLSAQPEGTPNLLAMAVAGLVFLGMAIYQIYLLSTKGQTLGKKWVGIKIVRQDGGPVTFGSAFVMRYFVGQGLLGIIPLYGLVDILCIFRDDKRCIHDMVASTKVVSVE